MTIYPLRLGRINHSKDEPDLISSPVIETMSRMIGDSKLLRRRSSQNRLQPHNFAVHRVMRRLTTAAGATSAGAPVVRRPDSAGSDCRNRGRPHKDAEGNRRTSDIGSPNRPKRRLWRAPRTTETHRFARGGR